MSNAQYESVKDAFEDDSASERIGIYYSEADGKYAIVVRMPEDNRPLLAGVGAAIGAAGLGIGALARNGVTIRGKSKWIEAFEPFLKDAHLLSTMYAVMVPDMVKEIEAIMSKIANQSSIGLNEEKSGSSEAVVKEVPSSGLPLGEGSATELAFETKKLAVEQMIVIRTLLLPKLEINLSQYKHFDRNKKKLKGEIINDEVSTAQTKEDLVSNIIQARNGIEKATRDVKNILEETKPDHTFRRDEVDLSVDLSDVVDQSTKVLAALERIKKYDTSV
jgi:hypothetical protein